MYRVQPMVVYTNVWCLSDYYGGNMLERCQFAIHLVKPGDYIICYPYPEFVEFVNYYCREYKLDPKQVIWTTGKNSSLHTDIRDYNIDTIINIIKKHSHVCFIPTMVDKEFLEWYQLIRVSIQNNQSITYCGDGLDWIALWGRKSILHPRWSVDNSQGKTQNLSSLRKVLPSSKEILPQGYICYSRSDVYQIWDKWNDKNSHKPVRLVLKDIDSCGGAGIQFINRRSDIENALVEGEFLVERNLQDLHQKLLFFAITFEGQNINGDPFLQVFNGDTFYSGSHSFEHPSFPEIKQWTQKILEAIKPQGRGGFDFCVGDDSHIYLLDVNTARFNGSHYAQECIRDRLKTNCYFYQYRVPMKKSHKFKDVVKLIEDHQYVRIMNFHPHRMQLLICADNWKNLMDRKKYLDSYLVLD